jgi:hypothetical protein
VHLTWTRCNYGGKRPWFICLGGVEGDYCGRRVAKLYGADSYFLCRHCYRLVYDSQRQDYARRKLTKTQNIRARLGSSRSLLEPFPPKPKGMHWSTYWRLRLKAMVAEQQSLATMRVRFDRMTARLKGADT